MFLYRLRRHVIALYWENEWMNREVMTMMMIDCGVAVVVVMMMSCVSILLPAEFF